MSILDWFIQPDNQDPTDKLLMNGLKRFGQFQAIENVESHISDTLMPDHDKELDRILKELDIRTKKRMLGMPETSEDLDEMSGSSRPFWTVSASHVLQRIPEAGFMSGKPLESLYKTARSVPNDSIPSLVRRIARAVG